MCRSTSGGVGFRKGKRHSSLSFKLPVQPRQAAPETFFVPAIDHGMNCSNAIGLSQRGQRFARECGGSRIIARATLVMDGELFVRFEAFTRGAEHGRPQRFGLLKIARALGYRRQRTPRLSPGIFGKSAADRALIELPGAKIAAPLANSRYSEELQRVLSMLLGIREQRYYAQSERRESPQIHLVVVKNWHQSVRRAAAKEIEIDGRNQLGHDVRAAIPLQDVPFEFRQPDGPEPRPPQILGRMQKIEVRARHRRLDRTRHAITGLEQRPIE